jgi:hypothetical protein
MSEETTTVGVGDRKMVAGLPWVQTDRISEGVPIWKLDLREELKTYFVLKDYGRHDRDESEAFSGVRLVSGGPFTSAGRWFTIDEAMEGVAPYIKALLRERIEDARAEIKQIEDAIAEAEAVTR